MGMGLLLADAAPSVSNMGTAFKGASDQIIAGIGEVAPYALAVMVVFLVWRYGTRFFKSIAK